MQVSRQRLCILHKSVMRLCFVDVQAVVNEDTTADVLMLQKENERLRKELDIFRHLQQVRSILQAVI